MKGVSLVIVLAAVVQWSNGFSAYNRKNVDCREQGACQYSPGINQQYNSAYASSSSSDGYGSCCSLDNWTYAHLNDIRQFAGRLRQEYNSMSSGSTTGYSTSYTPWSESIISLTGKTSGELDAICRLQGEELVRDMQRGLVSYNIIAQPNFFEWKSSNILQKYALAGMDYGQQQTLDLDLSNFDDVRTYSYPEEVKVVDGKTIVVHQNVTEAHKRGGEGTYQNPYVTVVKRNRTVVTTNTLPGYSGNGAYINAPGGSSVGTRKSTIYDWVNKNMEPSVVDYSPVVKVDSSWGSTPNSYKPPTRIPTDTIDTYETENSSSASQGYLQNYRPGSEVTVRRYNKTVITNADGTVVSGSESRQKWIDGKLVYDHERPFGDWSVPRDEEWKRLERERFFWFLNSSANTTLQSLEAWQRNEEERISALAKRYHCSMDDIYKWHREELQRYQTLSDQYRAQTTYNTAWQNMERGRLDWLIHQNSYTRDDLQRWQEENFDKLNKIARQYRITVDDLKNWQIEELDRLYVFFNDQDYSQAHIREQHRLDELIRQHNATIDGLQNSIKMDQQKLYNLSQKYRGNIDELGNWLKTELSRLSGIINQQHNKVDQITEWQRSERNRLENIFKNHRGSVGTIDEQLAKDRMYLESLANEYHVSIDALETWQRMELERLQNQFKSQFELDLKEWQRKEHEHFKKIITQNDLSVAEFQAMFVNDRQRLQQLASTYNVQIAEVQEWLKKEINELKNEGFLTEVKQQLVEWQQKERERLMTIVQQSEATVQDLELKMKADRIYLNQLAAHYHVEVSQVEEWLKQEIRHLQSQGLIKSEELNEWQKAEREQIIILLQNNKLTVEEFESKLLNDRQKLSDLAKTYKVEMSEIENFIKKESEKLKELGVLQIQEQLTNWQKLERERIMKLVEENNLSIMELKEQIAKDQTHLYSMAHKHQVHVEQIEEWIKEEIQKLQDAGLLEIDKLKGWQIEWRNNLTEMVKERDFTVEKFQKWFEEDHSKLQALAMQHNVQIEEIEQWVQNEEKRFVALGLLKPNEKLTNWQEVERRYLERITQQKYQSIEQLEQRLRQDRELLEKLAADYQIQVEVIESFINKELLRLRDEGQLQINNLTAWQISETARLNELLKENSQWSAEEFEQVLKQDRDHMQKTAFQYHTSVEEIEKWIRSEVERLKQQGKLNIEKMTQWQKEERQRIFHLLQQQSRITAEEFEMQVKNDRSFLMNLARQYRVNVDEVEKYVEKVIQDLREKGKFELEELKSWQLAERNYIMDLINQHKNEWSTKEFEEKLRRDREHVNQLADFYRVSVKDVEQFMIKELLRLRNETVEEIVKLSAWQVAELEKLKKLIRENSRLNYLQFEVELKEQHDHIQRLSRQYSISVTEIEQWLRAQLLNLKTLGDIQIKSLANWQEDTQQRLIALCLQQQSDITNEEFEQILRSNRDMIQKISVDYNVSVHQIDEWMKNELSRLRNSGLVQFEKLSNWQKIERERLQDWLKQQKEATVEELDAFIRRDEARFARIAQDYKVTVEDIKSWVKQESARLELLGLVRGPYNRKLADWEFVPWPTSKPGGVVVTEEQWREQTKAHLQAIALAKPMSWQDFEQYLINERMRWQQFARQYNISVTEIESWLTQVAQLLADQGLIHGKAVAEEWETHEQMHIQQLITDKLRRQQQWSIEELERQLINDRGYLQRLIQQYHLTMEQITEWYKQELQKLLKQRKIVSESLTEWQREEKDRLYQLVSRNPYKTQEQWLQEILRDQTTLNRICDQYHVTTDQVEMWTRKEILRLANLGLFKGTQTATTNSNRYNGWKELERQRLRAIAAELSITRTEFLEFIAQDDNFQRQLTRMYGCPLEELAPFQKVQIEVMNREGLLDRTSLLEVEPWQKQERDRLYSFIKDKSYNLNNLRHWQKQETLINRLAGNIGITSQELKDWQIKEFERIQQLAQYYNMNLNQLQDFRDKEMRFIAYVMHKKTATDNERMQWDANESRRYGILQRKTGVQLNELKQWRRKLYLLCQARLPFSYESGWQNGPGTTNRTAPPTSVISKDRGDQPPNVFDENIDNDEPGVAGPKYVLPSPPRAQLRTESTQHPGNYGGYASSGRYSKKEYEYSLPHSQVSGSYAHHYSHAAGQMQSDAGQMSADDSGQQQVQMEDDYGQQVQVEDLAGAFDGSSSSPYTQESYSQQQQQQLEAEDLNGTFTHHQPLQNEDQAPKTGQIEVQAEPESPGLLGRLKNKIFG